MDGLATVVSTGCASGADAVGVAFEAIQWGHGDVMLAVGVEAPIEPLTINAFDALGALSHRNDDPAHASRPFDKDRDGFVLGEGAAVLLMERMDRAVERGAHIYGEIRSYATTLDAYHMTAPRHDLSKSTIAVREALRSADVAPPDIDYISAHATSTPLGDLVETRLVKRVFGERAYEVPISSTKSVIGHQSGGAGVFQAASNLLTLEHQTLIPTVNLAACSKDCDLDYVPGVARRATVDCVLQHTFGFSGKNSALVVAHADYPWLA
jgi:3-oxoacyl-[acyl-carrier-protein] synthase II